MRTFVLVSTGFVLAVLFWIFLALSWPWGFLGAVIGSLGILAVFYRASVAVRRERIDST